MNSSIENNLLEYVRKIDNEGVFNKHDEKLIAEDFFMRLFELIYGWKSLVNLNYTEKNAEGIDLYDIKKGIAIQVTAIQSNERKKIEKDTVEKIIRYHSSKKINQIICFFIRDNKALENISEIELSKNYGRKISIKTTRQIIGDFQKIISPEERKRIEEIVKQELSPEFNGLSHLSYFKSLNKIITSTEYITPENAIYFSKFEKKKITEIASLFNKNKTKEYAILGNPCSGKSTFTKAKLLEI
jgi:Fe2+ transport system protein B